MRKERVFVVRYTLDKVEQEIQFDNSDDAVSCAYVIADSNGINVDVDEIVTHVISRKKIKS